MIGALAVGLILGAAAPPARVLVDNATVHVTRTRIAPGTGETPRTDPFPLLIVQLTAGEVDLTIGDARTRGPRGAGLVTFVPPDTPHGVKNVGAAPFDLIAIALKPTRPAAPAAPPTEAPPGITRTTLIDNRDVRVVRVRFARSAREPVHTHPNDLLTVQLTPGTYDIVVSAVVSSGRRATGFTKFLPRDASHAYISTDSRPFDLLSISIK